MEEFRTLCLAEQRRASIICQNFQKLVASIVPWTWQVQPCRNQSSICRRMPCEQKEVWVWRGFVWSSAGWFLERERSVQAAVSGRGREMKKRRVLEVVWRFKAVNLEAACTLGLVGFNLLSQLTELTTSCIYLTSNGIPIYDACSCLLFFDNFGQ